MTHYGSSKRDPYGSSGPTIPEKSYIFFGARLKAGQECLGWIPHQRRTQGASRNIPSSEMKFDSKGLKGSPEFISHDVAKRLHYNVFLLSDF